MSGRPAAPVVLVALHFLLQARIAQAEPIALSALPLSNDDIPKAAGKERMTDVRNDANGFITALDQPVCVDGTGASAYGFDGYIASDTAEVDRLELGDSPVLDRIILDTESQLPVARVLRRLRVPLRLVVDGPLPVFAYRTKTQVAVLVPRGFASAREAFVMERQIGVVRERCGFDLIQIPIEGGFGSTQTRPPSALGERERWATVTDVRDPAPPLTSTLWFVNASLSKVTRDPEPILSVLVREPHP